VRPGSPVERGKIDGKSIKYEKMKNKIVSVSFFVRSILVLDTQDLSRRVFVLIYRRKGGSTRPEVNIYHRYRCENQWFSPFLAQAEGFSGGLRCRAREEGFGKEVLRGMSVFLFEKTSRKRRGLR